MIRKTKTALDVWLAGAVAMGVLSFTADVSGAEASSGGTPSLAAQASTRTNLEVLSDLEKKLKDLKAEEQMIWARTEIDSAGRPTGEQLARLDAIEDEAKQITAIYERRHSLQARSDFLEAGTGRKTQPTVSADGKSVARANPASIIDRDDVQRHGFATLGHFAAAVMTARINPGQTDGRLRHFTAAESSFQRATPGEDGGYLIPPAFMRDIYTKVRGPDALLPRTRNMSSDSDVVHLPVNDEQAGLTSGAIKAYWVGEGADMTRTKAKLKNKIFELHELGCLIFASNKSLRNASLLGSLIREEAPKAINRLINTSIITGSGAAQPRGLMNSPSKIAVAKESGQTADTIRYPNIVKMWNRLNAELRMNAIWLINQDVEPQLELMEFPTTTGATAVPVYLPPGGASETPYARIKGRPVIPQPACKTLGDEGDIILTDLQTYMTITAGGIEEDNSAHLAFDQNLTAFKFMFSIHGDSLWMSAEQPENGSTTYSNIVTLAERA